MLYMAKNRSVRNRIYIKLVSNKNDYLKWASKPSYMPHKIFDNDLVTIRKSNVILTLNKRVCVGLEQRIIVQTPL